MAWIKSLPYSKALPFAIYVVIYFIVTDRHVRYPDEQYWTVIFKLLPTLSLVFMVTSCSSQNSEHAHFKRYIIFGFFFSMAGDACLVWRHKLFIPGLLFFAVAHCTITCAYKMKPFGAWPVFVLNVTMG